VNTFVVAGGIVRNRAWILERHLNAVTANGPDELFYLTGDNEDNTETFFNGHGGKSRPRWESPSGMVYDTNYVLNDTGEEGWTRDGIEGPRYNSYHMGGQRNLWAMQILGKFGKMTHVWNVDSDILPEPDVLEKLLSLNAPVAAAYVPVANNEIPIAMIGWDYSSGMARRTGDEKILTKPHVATLVGGCYLIKRQVLEETLLRHCSLWGKHAQGEDGFFGDTIRNIRKQMIHHPGAKCQHIMKRDR